MKWKRLAWIVAAAAAMAIAGVQATNHYYRSSAGEGCARCHEIRNNVDQWSHSTHRQVACVDCHESSSATNLRRVALHFNETVPEQIHLKLSDVLHLAERCKACHQQEYAQWKSGPHSATYTRIFTEKDHNSKRRLMDDCLRCHGMHFDGSVKDLVQPINTTGPWQLSRKELGAAAAIPCLACHAIHREGEPLARKDPRVGTQQEVVRPSVALMDRRSRLNLSVQHLPIPAMFDGDRAVQASPDRRQALCYQCHAPEASRRIGSGDDRTPVGVHEGLSCLACHQKHGMTTRASCADCHPRLSNCGLDVEKMDTTFLSPKSTRNIHTVKCADCHPKGVTRKRKWDGRNG